MTSVRLFRRKLNQNNGIVKRDNSDERYM
uniref:Uncharacterized protein n=1 Tax=Arundo donax TaxID=35708 RepID=A0A0A8ZFA2_ARUDO